MKHGIWPQLDKRITSYLVSTLDLEPGPARVLQKQLYYRHGSSLRGLIEEYNIDYSVLSADPALGSAIEALPGRKLILTNGTCRHAESVATRLGILEHFEAMFEDAEQNLKIPCEIGMRTTLVVPRTPDPYREEFEQEPIVAGHIHHVTNDLASFLRLF